MNIPFSTLVRMIYNEIPFTEELNDQLKERIDSINLVFEDRTDFSFRKELFSTDDYIYAAALIAKVKLNDLPPNTDKNILRAVRWANTDRMLEGMLINDPEVYQRAMVEMKKVIEFEEVKMWWTPYLKRILHPIPIEAFDKQLDFSYDIIAALSSNEEVEALSADDYVREMKRISIRIKEEDSFEVKQLTIAIRQELFSRQYQLEASEINDSIVDYENLKIMEEVLKPLDGLNRKKQKIMSSDDFSKLIAYTEHLVLNDTVPKNVQPIQCTNISAEHIKHTFYLLHQRLFGTNQIHNSFIEFLHKIFIQFSNMELKIIKSNFKRAPKNYFDDFIPKIK